MLLRGAGAFATEGIKESEVLHKVQSEVAPSAVKYSNELQSEVCLWQDDVWILYFEERRGRRSLRCVISTIRREHRPRCSDIFFYPLSFASKTAPLDDKSRGAFVR